MTRQPPLFIGEVSPHIVRADSHKFSCNMTPRCYTQIYCINAD
jgi:hypothetical protein